MTDQIFNPFLDEEADAPTIENPFLEEDDTPITPAPAAQKPKPTTRPLADRHQQHVQTAAASRQKTGNTTPANRQSPAQAMTKPLGAEHQQAVKTAATAPKQPVKNTAHSDVPIAPERLKIPSLGAPAPAPTKSKRPVQLTPEYRESLTDEQREANRKRREARDKARGQAILRGDTPWDNTKPKKKKHWLHRARLTENDLFIFYYLAKFKYTTPRILARAMGVKEETAYKRLRQHKDKYLYLYEDMGIKLWYPRQRAISELERHGWETPKINIINPETGSIDLNGISHHLALQWAAIELKHGNTVLQRQKNILSVETWSQIIPETAMRGDRQAMNGNDPLLKEKKKAVGQAVNGEITWQEMFEDRPAFWIMPGNPRLGIGLKIPDLAISFEHQRTDDHPRSAAIEVELSQKSQDEYAEIFRQYAYDDSTYNGVIYVVNSETTAKNIVKAAKKAKFNRVLVTYLTDEDGELIKRGTDLLKGKK